MRPSITGLAQVNEIEKMPRLLAETDAKMLASLTVAACFRHMVMTVLGKGGGG